MAMCDSKVMRNCEMCRLLRDRHAGYLCFVIIQDRRARFAAVYALLLAHDMLAADVCHHILLLLCTRGA